MRSTALLCLLASGAMLLCQFAPLASGPESAEQVARKAERGLLRVRNTTPYILSIYVAGVRVGWIRPFRTELFRGLRDGYHRVYAVSEYGSAAWGPRDVAVPGNINVILEGKAAEDAAMVTASRVFSANKASLVACDKLAERRGESVSEARVEFTVEVDAQGKSKVSTHGEGASSSLLACYRTMVSQWKYPATGSPYSISFSHVH